MTLDIKHPFVNPQPDGVDTTIARPSDWNANHPIVMSQGIIGRTESGDGAASVLPLAGTGNVVLSSQVREKLLVNQTRYLRYNLGRCLLSIGSPAVVTMHDASAHGLQINDPVIFSLPFDMPHDTVGECTISIASPCVVSVATFGTYTGHGFDNDDPVAIWTSGALPTGLTANRTNTLTRYFVRNKTDTTYEVSATAGGASINTSGTQSGRHVFQRASWLPTGGEVIEGKVYYIIATGFTTTSFQFSETLGGAAVNTSGTQAGKITLQTGNKANDGLTLSRSGAFLYPQDCIRQAQNLDLNGRYLTYQVAEGTYLPDPAAGTNRTTKNVYIEYPIPDITPLDGVGESWSIGGGRVKFWGAPLDTNRNNVVWRTVTGACVWAIGPLPWNLHFRGICMDAGGGNHFYTVNLHGYANSVYIDHLSWRGDSSNTTAIYNEGGYIAMHGKHMLFCGPSAAFCQSVLPDGYTMYVAPGTLPFGGIVAYEPQNYSTAMWYADDGSYILLGAACKCEGSFTGPPYWIRKDSKVSDQRSNTNRSYEWPGSLPPVIETGGVLYSEDFSTTNLKAHIRPDWTAKRLAADFEKTDSTLANVTGFSVPIPHSGINYRLEATIYTTSDVAAGIKFALSGTAAVSELVYEVEVLDVSATFKDRATALDEVVGATTTVSAATVRISGSFLSTTTDGFMRLQFAQNVTNATASKILRGSTFSVTPVTLGS